MKYLREKVEGYTGYDDPTVSSDHYENVTRMYAAVWTLEAYYQSTHNWLVSKTTRHQYLARQVGKGLMELLKGFKQSAIAMEKTKMMRHGKLVTMTESFEDDMLFNATMLDRVLKLPEHHREELLTHIEDTYFKETKDGNN